MGAICWGGQGWGAWLCRTEKLDPGPGLHPHPPPVRSLSTIVALPFLARLGCWAAGQVMSSLPFSRLPRLELMSSAICVGWLSPRNRTKALTLITYRPHDHEPASSQISTRLAWHFRRITPQRLPQTQRPASRQKGRY
ncbi:hypothetical protein M440DRAFT_1258068 [Trichoderma longibrachiatum ATCC 18648]|uniref:Uncharacterized protein n=1 Tax=Trichoderma longibrachiatum ATCC 18648 TaxID=983965 RepID=A0A2T4C240_TRILO|nr:hypothetical protein M440DRAFT_1258068 [Trichoderma longibrachiatum ATCC 18648]